MIAHKKHVSVNPIVVTVAATVVGTGIAVALSNKKNREKVKDLTLDFIEILKIKPNIGKEIHAIKKIITKTKKAVEENI